VLVEQQLEHLRLLVLGPGLGQGGDGGGSAGGAGGGQRLDQRRGALAAGAADVAEHVGDERDGLLGLGVGQVGDERRGGGGRLAQRQDARGGHRQRARRALLDDLQAPRRRRADALVVTGDGPAEQGGRLLAVADEVVGG